MNQDYVMRLLYGIIFMSCLLVIGGVVFWTMRRLSSATQGPENSTLAYATIPPSSEINPKKSPSNDDRRYWPAAPGEIDAKRSRETPARFHKPECLLTNAELAFYRCLQLAIKDRFIVCPKVRLADLLTLKEFNQSDFNRVCSKHVDFVLCDANLRPQFVIELNDSSHNRPDRRERDALLKTWCDDATLPLVQIRASRSYSVAEINRQIGAAIGS